jgi:hypothetical protein
MRGDSRNGVLWKSCGMRPPHLFSRLRRRLEWTRLPDTRPREAVTSMFGIASEKGAAYEFLV